MDKSLFEIKPTFWQKVRRISWLIFCWITVVIIPSTIIGAVVTQSMWWYSNTVFIDKLEYKWALEKQYNNGRHNERMCAIISNGGKSLLNTTQKEFCTKHSNYKDHPPALGE